MSEPIGYEDHVCHFCHKKEAGYLRREDGGTRQYFDACEKCASKPYEEKNGADTEKVSV
jgi:hypothetical protein